MMSKLFKYLLSAVAVLLLLYLSLDIENLQEHRFQTKKKVFDATEYAARFWEESLPKSMADATPMPTLLASLNDDPQEAFSKYGRKLGMSKTHYFMVRGTGVIKFIEDEYLMVSIDSNTNVRIATDFIFGNAVRDGSGQVDINRFLNMTDFNNVSVAIDKLVKEKVVLRLKKMAALGKQLEFVGAVEIQEDQINLDLLRVIPVMTKVSDEKEE
jgi:predicted lipoprotein